mgnify:FL=1
MNIYSKNIYEIVEQGIKKHIVIIYNISENHYVRLNIYNNEYNNFLYLKSINKFVDINSLREYSRNNICRPSLY